MSDKIQMTEEQARKFLDSIISTENDDHDALVNRAIMLMMQIGYIKKSDLEIAEDLYYKACSSGNINISNQLRVSHKLINELRKEIERLKDD